MKKLNIYMLISFLAFAACKPEPVYQKSNEMKGNTWSRFDNQTFEIPIAETGKSYAILLTMKLTPDFPYDEFPVFATLKTPAGEERTKEFNLKLRDYIKTGDKSVNDSLYFEFPLWKELFISDKGKCTLTIENIIPKIETPGIKSVGILVKKSANP
jgi:gliding motility-associated lipoprotein GldH